jgi:hypothetical protein
MEKILEYQKIRMYSDVVDKYQFNSKKFITEKYGVKVIVGTHSIPQKYYITHTNLNTWNNEFLQESVKPTLTDKLTRLNYD